MKSFLKGSHCGAGISTNEKTKERRKVVSRESFGDKVLTGGRGTGASAVLSRHDPGQTSKAWASVSTFNDQIGDGEKKSKEAGEEQ